MAYEVTADMAIALRSYGMYSYGPQNCGPCGSGMPGLVCINVAYMVMGYRVV